MKTLAWVFALLAVLLSDLACAVTAYNWCDLSWGAKYLGYSAPPSVALLLGLPYLLGAILMALLAFLFYRKAQR